jgi:hypothetical protein
MGMAKLTGKVRRRLSSSKFAYPKQRKYPINDAAHARNALSRAAQSKTSGSYAGVLRAIKRSSNPAVRAVGKGKTATRRKSTTRRRRR